MLRTIAGLCAALILSAAALPAAAQSREEIHTLPLKPGQGFEHKATKFEMPATLDGLRLGELDEIGEGQVDIFGRYGVDGVPELLTVYIFRQASGGLPVWFDRAIHSLNESGAFGTPTRLPGGGAFVPPGQTIASGLIATFSSAKAPFQSTGVAIVPMGDWLIKIRYSSASIAPDQMEARIRTILGALHWPGKIPAPPAVAEVLPCAAPLQFTGTAQPVKPDGANALGAALMSVQLDPKPGDPPKPNPVWCKDAMQLPYGALFRADNETNGYLIALSDAGLAVRVQPNAANIIASEINKDAKPNWSVQLIELARITNYVPRDRMPLPDDAAKVINEGHYASRVTTFGDSKIEINSDFLK
jgi:hypothetical protein